MARSRLFDSECLEIIERTPDAAVSWFLMASFAYYHLDRPIISDGLFDDLCKRLLARWWDVHHPHLHLLRLDDLRAGTGFALKREDYPSIVIGATHRLLLDGIIPPQPAAPAPALAAEPAGQMSLF